MKFHAEILVQENNYLEEYPVRLFIPFHVQEGVGDSSSVALTINSPLSCEGVVASVAPSHCPVICSISTNWPLQLSVSGTVQKNNQTFCRFKADCSLVLQPFDSFLNIAITWGMNFKGALASVNMHASIKFASCFSCGMHMPNFPTYGGS